MFDKIRPLVFWPSFLILMAAVVMSFIDLDGFLRVTQSLNATLLDRFSWFFSLGSFYLLMLVVVVYFPRWEKSESVVRQPVPCYPKPVGFQSRFAPRSPSVFCSGPLQSRFIT